MEMRFSGDFNFVFIPFGLNGLDWIVQCLCPHQHSIGYLGDGFYTSKYPTNSIKVLKEATKVQANNTNNKIHTYTYTIHIKRINI